MNRRKFIRSILTACAAIPVAVVGSKLLHEPQRDDAATRLSRYTSGVQEGWLTRYDVRIVEDLELIPADTEFLEMRRLNAFEICRAFDVPPEVVLSDIERSRLRI